MIINFDDFQKLDLRVAKILAAEKVEGSEKLVKLQIDLGGDRRQIIAGIGKVYAPEELVGKEIAVVVNLEPRVLMGLESQGMLLAVQNKDGEPILLIPEKPTAPGSKIS